MANTLDVYQAKSVFSVYRDTFMTKVVMNEELTKKDLRVLNLLLTKLPGFLFRPNRDDPEIYETIHVKTVADTLNLRKKDVEESIEHLFDLGLIEKGSNRTVKNGWRFTF